VSLLISASWIARITDVSHQHLARCYSIHNSLRNWSHSGENGLLSSSCCTLTPACVQAVGIDK
jgi:hypothetical protein